MSSIWNKPLNRDTFDDFFHLFAPAAYRSSYRVLGDSTRTENALMEAFLEIYQKRNADENADLLFMFSDLLQKRVELLAAQYPLSETSKPGTRALDEFTENALLDEIHRRIDSAPFRLVEAFTSSATSLVSSHSEPLVLQIRKTGITLLLIIQLILTGILIGFITSTAGRLFGITGLAPKTPEKQDLSIMDSIVMLLDYLPLRPYEAETTDAVEETTVPTSVQTSSEQATVSATKG